MENKIVSLPSGAKLEIMIAPFLDAQGLYEAVLEEGRSIKIDSGDFGVENLVKDLFCMGLSSARVKAALGKCMGRALYNGLPIGKDTWEPAVSRQDYIPACMAVAMENIQPFTMSLYAQFKEAMGQLQKLVKSFPA